LSMKMMKSLNELRNLNKKYAKIHLLLDSTNFSISIETFRSGH
jgi:hypothetical protein